MRVMSVWQTLSSLHHNRAELVLKSACLPFAIRVSHWFDDDLAVHDMLDARKDLLNVFPVYDALSINMVAGDLFGDGLSH